MLSAPPSLSVIVPTAASDWSTTLTVKVSVAVDPSLEVATTVRLWLAADSKSIRLALATVMLPLAASI